MAKTVFKISVNNLLSTTMHSGDINFRFSSRSSAAEGIKGHQRLQRSRPDDYLAEVAVKGQFQWNNLSLEVGGRMDGVYTGSSPVVVDEIKTLRVSVADLPDSIQSLHWGQAKIYGWFYALEHELTEVTLQLSYLHLDTNETTQLQKTFSAVELKVFYEKLASQYLQWMEKIIDWRENRNESINNLDFPYGEFRQGQRPFAVSVYRAMVSSQQLFVQAPTGIGKSIGTLFPAIKAMGEGVHEKLFYLTAKSVGRGVAEKTLEDMSTKGLLIKTVTLTAKDKICFNPGSPCDPEHCEYAVAYYDKLDDVIDDSLVKYSNFNRDRIEVIARDNHMCPFELSLDLASWVDCIICDYNYVFDPVVYLRRFFDEPTEEYGFLIDEAHNLVDRGRDMFSAQLEKGLLMKLKRKLNKKKDPGLSIITNKLQGVNRAFLNLAKENDLSLDKNQYAVLQVLPAGLLKSMRTFCEYTQGWLAENERKKDNYDELLSFYFDVLRMIRTADFFDEKYVCLIKRPRKNNLEVKLYCVDPSKMLKLGLDRARSTIFFSATLSPVNYYQNLLGVNPDSLFVDLPSPFPPENLGVFVVGDIATNYRQRSSSYEKIVDVISAMTKNHSGNYLVFFPSYQYMEQVYGKYCETHPHVPTLIQSRAMTEDSRQHFLEQFTDEDSNLLVGFAVMGGIFSEGIDLQGNKLIGVIVVGVGLPQIGIDRDLIKNHFDNGVYDSRYSGLKNESLQNEWPQNQQAQQQGINGPNYYNMGYQGMGFDYAYQFPGMVRVLQTAGRVIRSEQDRGVVCLIDDRFNQQRYRRLFPPHWSNARTTSRSSLENEIQQFWNNS